MQRFISELNQQSMRQEEPRKFILSNFQKLGKMLTDSMSDKIDTTALSELQTNAVQDPSKYITQPLLTEDVAVDKFKLYNCYTEIFKHQNLINIERENKRALDVILN